MTVVAGQGKGDVQRAVAETDRNKDSFSTSALLDSCVLRCDADPVNLTKVRDACQ